jgi:hypothetical protein
MKQNNAAAASLPRPEKFQPFCGMGLLLSIASYLKQAWRECKRAASISFAWRLLLTRSIPHGHRNPATPLVIDTLRLPDMTNSYPGLVQPFINRSFDAGDIAAIKDFHVHCEICRPIRLIANFDGPKIRRSENI